MRGRCGAHTLSGSSAMICMPWWVLMGSTSVGPGNTPLLYWVLSLLKTDDASIFHYNTQPRPWPFYLQFHTSCVHTQPSFPKDLLLDLASSGLLMLRCSVRGGKALNPYCPWVHPGSAPCTQGCWISPWGTNLLLVRGFPDITSNVNAWAYKLQIHLHSPIRCSSKQILLCFCRPLACYEELVSMET